MKKYVIMCMLFLFLASCGGNTSEEQQSPVAVSPEKTEEQRIFTGAIPDSAIIDGDGISEVYYTIDESSSQTATAEMEENLDF